MPRPSRSKTRRGPTSPSSPAQPQPQPSGVHEAIKSPAPPPSWRGRALFAVGLIALITIAARWETRRGRGRTHAEPPLSEGPARLAEGPASPGQIETRDIELRVPEALAAGYPCIRDMETWRFGGYTVDRVVSSARAAGFASAEAERMRALAQCDVGGCSVTPDVALVTTLGPEVRNALYQMLRRFPENRLQYYPFLRPRALGAWSEMRDLDPRVRTLFAQGTWSAPNNYAFSDLPWICNTVETDAQRAQVTAAIRTRYSLDAWVRVPPTGDLDPLVRYWSAGSDPDAVRATLLEARQGDGRAHLAALLPPMARARVDQYARPSDPSYDCFWSAVNFFEGETPPSTFLGPEGTVAWVHARYAEVSIADARLGDVFVFEKPDGAFAHTANLVAGDIVFTKNGLSHAQPWVLMRLDDLRLRYLDTTLRAYRRR